MMEKVISSRNNLARISYAKQEALGGWRSCSCQIIPDDDPHKVVCILCQELLWLKTYRVSDDELALGLAELHGMFDKLHISEIAPDEENLYSYFWSF